MPEINRSLLPAHSEFPIDPLTGDTEFTLASGDQRVVVSPYGASLRRYFLCQESAAAGAGEIDLAWGYSGAAQKKGGQGDVLIPFPGRVAGGRYRFDGLNYELERNDKDGPNAIHGFLRGRFWDTVETRIDATTFVTRIDGKEFARRGYPFSIESKVTYRLTPSGLSCQFSIRNVGDRPAPAGAGFHPYFTVGTGRIDESELQFQAKSVLEFGESRDLKLIPTGRILPVEATPLDHTHSHRVGDTQFNHCFTDLARDREGRATVTLRNFDTGRGLTVWMDQAFPYLVLYTGDQIPAPDARTALAIEPMTCAADAFNHPEWGLKALAPGQQFSGTWGVRPA